MRSDKYFAIAQNGRVVESDTWESLQEKTKSQLSVEMYGVFLYDEPYVSGNGRKYYWPQIQILDADNKPSTYQRGAFKVKHIHKDDGSYYHKGRKIEFENCLTNQVVIIETPYKEWEKEYVTVQDFYFELINILDGLNKEIAKEVINNNVF